VPEQATLDFALDVNEELRAGDWDIRGKVTTVDGGVVMLQTEKGETARLAFKLPKGLALPLKPGEHIRIKRTVETKDAAFGWRMELTKGNEMLVEAACTFGKEPQKQRGTQGIVIAQKTPEKEQPLHRDKYGTVYAAKVDFTTKDGVSRGANLMDPISLSDGHNALIVVQSAKRVPNKKGDGVLEGPRFTLEYVIAPKER
jgi:hypothetical protein